MNKLACHIHWGKKKKRVLNFNSATVNIRVEEVREKKEERANKGRRRIQAMKCPDRFNAPYLFYDAVKRQAIRGCEILKEEKGEGGGEREKKNKKKKMMMMMKMGERRKKERMCV